MRKILKNVLVLLLAFSLILSSAAIVFAADSKLEKAVASAHSFMLKTVKNPQVGSIGGEWAVLGLARSGLSVPQEYIDSYYATVEKYVKACKGVLHEKKYTEYSRLTVALTSIGADPTNVAGYNLLTPLGDFDKTIWQGINGPIWALIALDSGNYDMPVNTSAAKQATRQMYIDEILSRQLKDGGWNLTDKGGSGKADPDITGMALQALAKYQNQAEVKKATELAIECLSKMQDSKGGYASWGTTNSESCVQVIVALAELGISLNDERFVKNGNSLLDNLYTFMLSDGSFLHTADGSGNNQMSSEQGFYGLIAALRLANGSSSLYRMNDVKYKPSSVVKPERSFGLDGMHKDITAHQIVNKGISFSDVKSSHKNYAAIQKLAEYGIIGGKGTGTFAPEDTMTRAEFATIVVKALGLNPKDITVFKDVTKSDWFSGYIGSAYSYGLVSGATPTEFNPNGTITRKEAATLVAKTAKLCGANTEMSAAEIRDMLAQFGDYTKVADWAKPSVAYCYSSGILDQADLDIKPDVNITRCEIAQMICNMMLNVNLIK